MTGTEVCTSGQFRCTTKVLQPDGVQTGISCAANIDAIVISRVNRLAGLNVKFFQTQSKRFRIGLGGDVILPRDNDNPKEFF